MPANTKTALRRSDKAAYSIPEICAETTLGRNSVYSEIAKGRLRITKVGRRTIVLAEDFRRWLETLNGAAA